jgi:hypothetical protein
MTEVVKVDPVTGEPIPEVVVTTPVPKPGEKTDPALLLASLQEERAEVRRLKEENEVLRNQKPTETPSGEVFSEEGKVLDAKIAQLQAEREAEKLEKALSSVQTQFPVLADKAAEFEAYRAANPGMKLETAATAFLVENNLLETTPPRKGLELSSGGPKAPVINDGSMTPDEVDQLRITNYREYVKRLKEGTLKIR